jgi:methionyl-tRNA formyltransferase
MPEPQKINRIVFFGTPDFAATILEGLLDENKWQLAAVYTQPDRPVGRSKTLQASKVKELALKHDLPVYQPESLQDKDVILQLKNLQPDLLIVAAYGLLLPQAVLDVAPKGALNVHASLLPKYRGAAPIQQAILNGEQVSGATIMQMEKGLDSGPILLQRALAIGLEDTAQSLHDQLAQLGARLLVQTISRLQEGSIVPIAQEDSLATYAPKLQKSDGQIDWHKSAWEVHNQVRATFPWPGAFTYFEAEESKPVRLAIFPGEIGEPLPEPIEPGQLVKVTQDALAFACKDRLYLTPFVQPAGRKKMDAKAFKCGYLNRCS